MSMRALAAGFIAGSVSIGIALYSDVPLWAAVLFTLIGMVTPLFGGEPE